MGGDKKKAEKPVPAIQSPRKKRRMVDASTQADSRHVYVLCDLRSTGSSVLGVYREKTHAEAAGICNLIAENPHAELGLTDDEELVLVIDRRDDNEDEETYQQKVNERIAARDAYLSSLTKDQMSDLYTKIAESVENDEDGADENVTVSIVRKSVK